MRSFAHRLCCMCTLLCLSGCVTPWNFRLPTVFNQPPDVERVEQQYHDPYPDSQLGPSTGTRPLQYNQQRPLPVRIREKSDGTRLLEMNRSSAPPAVSPSPGSQYPAVVPF